MTRLKPEQAADGVHDKASFYGIMRIVREAARADAQTAQWGLHVWERGMVAMLAEGSVADYADPRGSRAVQ